MTTTARLKRTVPVVLLGLLGFTAWINLPVVSLWFDGSADRIAALPDAPAVTKGQRVLVLSPHPDDETLCCGGMIQQARARGATVYVAWMTAGDGFEFDAMLTERVPHPTARNMRDLGQRRASEALRAVGLLGVPADHTFMLGYPDGGLFQLFTSHYDEAFTARHTGAASVYVRGALSPGAAYTGRQLEQDIRTVLNRVRPDLVLVPAPQDFHADHHTLSYIALRLLGERGQGDRLRFWVVHGGLEWPVPKGLHGKLPLTLPPRATTLAWQKVPLSAAEQRNKLAALNAYRTQMRVMGRFMQAFVRENELLSPEPLPDPLGRP